jgi:hypothetical protein
MGDIQALTRAAVAALLGISLLSCHPRHAPRQWNTSQREVHLRGPAAIAVVDLPALNRWADNAWLRVFLDHFDDLADSLERAGYAAGVTFRDTIVVTFPDTLVVPDSSVVAPDSSNPEARHTIVVTDGSNSVRLASGGLPITYFCVAPGRKPYAQGGGETAQRLLAQWGAWLAWVKWDTPRGPAQASVMRVPSAVTEAPVAPPAELKPCGHNRLDAAAGQRHAPDRSAPARLAAVALQSAWAQQDVEPAAREVIFDAIEQDGQVRDYLASAGERVGVFTRGKYRGYDLVLATYEQGPCKGEGCWVGEARFAKQGQEVVYLPKLSSDPWFDPSAFFQRLTCHFTTDTAYTNPLFRYPATLTGPEAGQTIDFVREGRWRSFDVNTVRKAFHDTALGDVYTTTHGPDFFVFRPDGTDLEYRYFPRIDHQEIRWTGQPMRGPTGQSGPQASTTDAYVDQLEPCGVVPDSFTDIDAAKDLNEVGAIEGRGPIFAYRDPHAAFLRELFEGTLYRHPERAHPVVSFETFLASRPVFFWRDPFGRMQRFINGSYRPPCEAEPIIYLYPVRRQVVSVTVNRHGHIVASAPRYDKGWQVEADPSGQLTNVADRKRYNHLFWEGWSSILDTPERGYVIEAAGTARCSVGCCRSWD